MRMLVAGATERVGLRPIEGFLGRQLGDSARGPACAIRIFHDTNDKDIRAQNAPIYSRLLY
jgi:hypothetical protein